MTDMYDKNIFELDFRPKDYQEAAIQKTISEHADRMARRIAPDIASDIASSLLAQLLKREAKTK